MGHVHLRKGDAMEEAALWPAAALFLLRDHVFSQSPDGISAPPTARYGPRQRHLPLTLTMVPGMASSCLPTACLAFQDGLATLLTMKTRPLPSSVCSSHLTMSTQNYNWWGQVSVISQYGNNVCCLFSQDRAHCSGTLRGPRVLASCHGLDILPRPGRLWGHLQGHACLLPCLRAQEGCRSWPSSFLLRGFPEGSCFLSLILEPEDTIMTKFSKQPKMKMQPIF
jgi:hypothetical protein